MNLELQNDSEPNIRRIATLSLFLIRIQQTNKIHDSVWKYDFFIEIKWIEKKWLNKKKNLFKHNR